MSNYCLISSNLRLILTSGPKHYPLHSMGMKLYAIFPAALYNISLINYKNIIYLLNDNKKLIKYK